jgi:hypothetical protein
MYKIGSKVVVKFKIIRMDHNHVLLEAIDSDKLPFPIHLSISKEDLNEHFRHCKGCKNLNKSD